MLISKINDLIAQIDYEIDVTNFLRDVEMQYWRLYLAYHTYEIERESLADANQILDRVQARADARGETCRASSKPATESCRPSSAFWTRSKGSTRTRLSCAILPIFRATQTEPFDRLMFRCWPILNSTGVPP